ncbi:uncharacterized protein LOC110452394 [Mizuhopecten yessoensis]|uniref:E3 ubiquitin-protein ligase RNF25 n=1 Tax=Mizuhopecten yessoensis TaxID=6573 RepID=A0A210R772_MIZYE|nr:uncharacterized protein LOC110452394 [Mizuhopecten yessoensis]OWF56798.1 E3 ubiquitin-protein ligase RNF25 [Mizuhopecten yessoensis]
MAAEHTFSAGDSIIQEELEVLESIYIDELEVDNNDNGHPSSITVQLHPSTGEDVHKKFVCMTLTLNVPVGYPNELPEILIRNPRGVGEEELESLHEAINELAEERRGGHMLYDIIELAKESLTEGNVPHCPCTICLDHFSKGEEFTRTGCYHYFHQHCLYRYVTHTLESLKSEAHQRPKHDELGQEDRVKVFCPVCREIMNYDLDLLSMSKRQTTEDDHQLYKPSAEICKWQVEMADILKSQKQKGGIIDLEAEKNKFLVTAEDTVKLPWQGTSSELDNLAKSSTNSKESRQAVDIKPITVEGKSRSAGLHGSNRERTNRQDHPRPSSGHTDRHQRYRGHRNNGRDGHRSNAGRNRGGHKVNRSYHTGQVDERERKADYDKEKRSLGRSVQTDATRSDRTDVSSGNVSPQHKEHKAVNERCETASKTEIESQFRTVNRGSAADDDPKTNKTNGDKSAITKDIEQDSAGQGQEDRDKSSIISPKESVEKQTERVSIDSDKSFQRKGFPASGGKISARSSNKTNYRGSESKNSEYENRNYYKGKNDDREREHSSRGRGQGRTERGHGRGSRRSANQEAVKSKPELEKNNTDPQEKGDIGNTSLSRSDEACDLSEVDSHGSNSTYKGKVSKELGFQRPNSGYKGRNQGFGRPSNRTQYHYDSYSKHGHSERREVSSKNDKGEVNGKFDIKGVNGKSNSGQVSYDHTRTRQDESAGTNKSSVKPGGKHNSETQNSKSDSFGGKPEKYNDRFVQDHKHWNKDKEICVCKGRSDTNTKDAVITGKERTSQPSCGVKRPPPGFTLVQKMNNDVKIPPGFEKSGISG